MPSPLDSPEPPPDPRNASNPLVGSFGAERLFFHVAAFCNRNRELCSCLWIPIPSRVLLELCSAFGPVIHANWQLAGCPCICGCICICSSAWLGFGFIRSLVVCSSIKIAQTLSSQSIAQELLLAVLFWFSSVQCWFPFRSFQSSVLVHFAVHKVVLFVLNDCV